MDASKLPKKRDKTYRFIQWGVVFLIFTLIAGYYSGWWGAEEIGHFWERSEYKTRYYVNLLQEKNYSKNYRVVGNIDATTSCYPDQSYPEGPEICDHVYYLTRAYFPNGGYLSFEDCSVKFNEKELCTDTKGEDWYIELTQLKVK